MICPCCGYADEPRYNPSKKIRELRGKRSKHTKGLKITAVYGGASIMPQIKSLKSGTQIIVGTPGRVIDLINRKSLRLQDIEFVVLDEAKILTFWLFSIFLTSLLQKILSP